MQGQVCVDSPYGLPLVHPELYGQQEIAQVVCALENLNQIVDGVFASIRLKLQSETQRVDEIASRVKVAQAKTEALRTRSQGATTTFSPASILSKSARYSTVSKNLVPINSSQPKCKNLSFNGNCSSMKPLPEEYLRNHDKREDLFNDSDDLRRDLVTHARTICSLVPADSYKPKKRLAMPIKEPPLAESPCSLLVELPVIEDEAYPCGYHPQMEKMALQGPDTLQGLDHFARDIVHQPLSEPITIGPAELLMEGFDAHISVDLPPVDEKPNEPRPVEQKHDLAEKEKKVEVIQHVEPKLDEVQVGLEKKDENDQLEEHVEKDLGPCVLFLVRHEEEQKPQSAPRPDGCRHLADIENRNWKLRPVKPMEPKPKNLFNFPDLLEVRFRGANQDVEELESGWSSGDDE